MIANRGYGRWAGAASFTAAIEYIRRDHDVVEQEQGLESGRVSALEPSHRVYSEWSRGVTSIETAWAEMGAVASQANTPGIPGESFDPIYHLVVSWAPGEIPSQEQAREALDYTLRRLGYGRAQYVATLHDDGQSGCLHLHAIVNRVDAITHTVHAPQDDFAIMRDAMRDLERSQSWRSLGVEREAPSRTLRFDRYAVRRVFREFIERDVAPGFRALVESPGATWGQVNSYLDAHGLRYEVLAPKVRATIDAAHDAVANVGEKGLNAQQRIGAAVEGVKAASRSAAEQALSAQQAIGARIVGVKSRLAATVRRIGYTHRELVQMLGDHTETITHPLEAREELRDRASRAAEAVEKLRPEDGWRAVHATLREHGVVYSREWRFSARLWDTTTNTSIQAYEIVGLDIKELEQRFGGYQPTAEDREVHLAREATKIARDLKVAHEIASDLRPVYDTLFANSSTTTMEEIDRDLAGRFSSELQRRVVREALESDLIGVTFERDGHKELRFTHRFVLESEYRLEGHALALASESLPSSVEREWRPFRVGSAATPAEREYAGRLDQQQRGAYEYAIAPESRLKLITGVAGAGKTTIVRQIDEAYREAGYDVRGVTISNDAARVLQRESGLPTMTVHKQLYEWGGGLDLLTARSVLIVDEVSTLGTEYGSRLLAEAVERGAVVIALGDQQQFGAVPRGSALGLIERALNKRGIEHPDMELTARQREPWMREASQLLRAGQIREALTAYRDRGCVHEAASKVEARELLIERWKELTVDGKDVAIVTLPNVERTELNRLAREAYRSLGKLEPDDHILATIDGRVPFATGDRVVFRANYRDLGIINGSTGTVTSIDDTVLHVRLSDGSPIRYDTAFRPEVQHEYARTAYSMQGATREYTLGMLTPGVDSQVLVVSATRHTAGFEAFFSRTVFRDGFDGGERSVVTLGERVRANDLASEGRVLGRADEALRLLERQRDLDNLRERVVTERGSESRVEDFGSARFDRLPTEREIAEERAVSAERESIERDDGVERWQGEGAEIEGVDVVDTM